ncbi:unnamed protein product [Prunus armeniaca]
MEKKDQRFIGRLGRAYVNQRTREAWAEKGSRASWAWFSLLEGRDALIKDSRCQIFYRKNTNIWKDIWLPPPHDGIINVRQIVLPSAPQQVYEIMEKETHSWKLELIKPYVQPHTLEIIRCCTIANTERQDRVVWPWTTNGAYSVKSGYRRIHSRCSYLIHATGSTSHSIPKEVWSNHIDPRLTIDRAMQNCREFLDAKVKSHVPFGDASVVPNILA